MGPAVWRGSFFGVWDVMQAGVRAFPQRGADGARGSGRFTG